MLESALTAAAAAGVDAARYALRAKNMAALDEPSPGLDDHGERAARRAEMVWLDDVREPSRAGKGGTPARIDHMIRDRGAMSWHWLKPYRRNGDSAWCGAFASAIYGPLGLKFSIRQKILPSTGRLYEKWQSRRVGLGNIRPGDIVVVGDLAMDDRGRVKKPQGDHITIAIEVKDGLVYTIEGNAKGLLPDGSIGEGVIKRTRPLPAEAGGEGFDASDCPVSGRPQSMVVLHAYRPHPEDFE